MGRKSVVKNPASINPKPPLSPPCEPRTKNLGLRAALQKWLKLEYPAGKSALSDTAIITDDESSTASPLRVAGFSVNPVFQTALLKISKSGNSRAGRLVSAMRQGFGKYCLTWSDDILNAQSVNERLWVPLTSDVKFTDVLDSMCSIGVNDYLGTDLENVLYPLAISHHSYPWILLRAKATNRKRLFLITCESGDLYHLGPGSWEDQLGVLASFGSPP
jgi:hypothetical protein